MEDSGSCPLLQPLYVIWPTEDCSDLCSVIWPLLTAAPEQSDLIGCSALFSSTPTKNQRRQFNISCIPSPKTAGLMSCSLLATPFLCCVAIHLHTSCVRACVDVHTLQQRYAAARPMCPCIPPSTPPPISISHSIPSPHRLWLLHSSVGTVTRGPTPGWIFEWRNGWMWMDWSRGRETEGGGWPGNDGVLPRQLARRGGADKCHPIWPRWCLSTHLRVDPRPCASTRPVVTSSLPLCLPLIFRHYLCLALL